MKTKSRIIGLLFVGLLFLFVLSSFLLDFNPPKPASPVMSAQDRFTVLRERAIQNRNALASKQSEPSTEKVAVQSQRTDEDAPRTGFPVYGTHWGQELIPELRDFSKWADRYAKVADHNDALIAEGVKLAKARREVIRDLIQMAPDAALASAIPREVRIQLPAVVLSHSERHIAGMGRFEVIAVLPDPTEKYFLPAVQRLARLQERAYQAHVYGQMKGFGTMDGVYLHGVAVDDLLALADTPMRPLEVGEPLVLGKPVEANHPVSLSLANQVRGGGGGVGPIFAEGKEGYKCLCCTAAEWDNYGAYLDAQASGGEITAAAIGRAYKNTGARDMLIIPVEFPDKAGSPWSTDSVKNSRISDIQDYFSTVSYGVFTLPTITTAPLQMMDENATYYTVEHDGTLGYRVLRDHALAKAKTSGYDSDSYDFVSIVINHNLYWWGGRGQLGDKISWIDGYSYGTELDQRTGTYTHELGHNLGLMHANAWDSATPVPDDTNGTHEEYGHEFDSMGSGSSEYDEEHFNACYKNALDWLPDSSIITVTADTTVDLYAMDQTQVSGRTYAIKIPAGITLGSSSNLDYWIEFRSRYPSNSTLDDGVLIYMCNNTLTSKALKLLDMNPSTSGVLDAGLDMGASFTTSDSRWKITVNSQTGSGATSFVNLSVVDARSPAITAHPSSNSTSYGKTVTFSVTATGPSLLYQWYKDGTVLSGETSSSLTISDFQESNKGDYHVVVTNAYGMATSGTAALSQSTGGGGGVCGSLPPINLVVIGWLSMLFSRFCLLVKFGMGRSRLTP